jgi:hypothetical protein
MTNEEGPFTGGLVGQFEFWTVHRAREYSPPRRGGVAARSIKKSRSHLTPRRRGGQFGGM